MPRSIARAIADPGVLATLSKPGIAVQALTREAFADTVRDDVAH